MIFGIFVQTCVLTVMTMRTDWDQQVCRLNIIGFLVENSNFFCYKRTDLYMLLIVKIKTLQVSSSLKRLNRWVEPESPSRNQTLQNE